MDFNLDAYVYSPYQKDHYGALTNKNLIKENSISLDNDRMLKVILIMVLFPKQTQK